MMDEPHVFLPFRLVAAFSDGLRLLFDGLTEDYAKAAMEAAQDQHGDITWYDGVTDEHYENGRYVGTLPTPPEITIIDLTDPSAQG